MREDETRKGDTLLLEKGLVSRLFSYPKNYNFLLQSNKKSCLSLSSNTVVSVSDPAFAFSVRANWFHGGESGYGPGYRTILPGRCAGSEP